MNVMNVEFHRLRVRVPWDPDHPNLPSPTAREVEKTFSATQGVIPITDDFYLYYKKYIGIYWDIIWTMETVLD